MIGRKADIDLTGKQFCNLFVNGPSSVRIRNRPTWECTCTCGKTAYYTTYELESGKRKSCGHLRGKSRSLDLTGQIFSDLTVMRKVPNKGNSISPNGNIVGRTYWHCVCSCGAECDIQTSDLTSGKRKDCGHSHNAYMHKTRTRDISGKVYGYLEVLEMLPSVQQNKRWRAMCKAKCLICGNIVDVQKDYLISGDTNSCGCLKSKGERIILDYLLKHNISHKTQYSFDDLKTHKNGRCYFDFCIFDDKNNVKLLIEFQGRQHYEKQEVFWNFGEYEREVTDPLKKEYCLSHNIPLYEIKYNSDIIKELDKIFAC